MTPRSEGTGRVALVLSEIFPPQIGGSGEFLANVYRRMRTPILVLADTAGEPPSEERDGTWCVRREDIRAQQWGLLQPAGLRHHLSRARHVRRLSAGGRTVVHCARALPEGVDAWLASLAGGAPYVCWAHGEDIVTALSSRELTWLTRAVFRRAAGIVANSHNTAGMLAAVGVDRSRVDVVHPGVDAERFRPDVPDAARVRSALAGSDEALLLTVGRLQRRKGHDLVLRTLRRLLDAGRRVRYAIVGEGEERARLEALAAELGVADRVRFAGAVPADALPAYFAAADVFCHPNRVDDGDIEGFGIVFLEAAAAGVPVIGGDSGGVPEAIDRDVTGLLVSGTSEEELEAALGRLLDDPALRRAMGAAGRERVCREFSWQRAADRVATVHDRAGRR